MSLARLQRWDEAAQALAAGQRKAPLDKRFPVELGGLAFARKNLREATKNLDRALKLDRSDRYAIDLLASVYFLENNLEAALQYWNCIGKPYIEQFGWNLCRRLILCFWIAPLPWPGRPARVARFLANRSAARPARDFFPLPVGVSCA